VPLVAGEGNFGSRNARTERKKQQIDRLKYAKLEQAYETRSIFYLILRKN
jgi:hypothetical protein